jgi:large subunit ribosomal protein L15
MNLGDLKPARGAMHRRKRVGCGTGSGHGGTSCRGSKGQLARTGKGKVHAYFEGGQLPHHRRMPKLGFTNPTRVEYQVVNVSDLAGFAAGSVVTPEELKAKRIVRHAHGPIKLLAGGKLEVALTVKVDAASEAARKKIEAAGGQVAGREA